MRLLSASVVLVLLGSVACAAFDEAIARKIVEDQEKIRTLEGTYVERGVVPGDPSAEVTSRLRFRAPSDLVVEVVAPEAYAGDVVAYVGSELFLYSRSQNAGVHVRGVPWSPTRWREAVRETVRWNRASYGFREEGKETVAGRESIVWAVTPREPGPLRVRSRWWLDAECSLPVRLDLGGLYALRYERLVLNQAGAPVTFAPPEASSFAEWDLSLPDLGLDAARRLADWRLLEATEPVEGLALARVVRARTNVFPALALVHERGPFWATVFENEDRGLVDPKARGVEVELGDSKGRISFLAATSLLVFVRDGVQVTVASNLPAPEVVRFARGLRAR